MKPKRGFLIDNEYKTKPAHPDFRGSITIGGSVYSLSGWASVSKAGKPYISLSVELKAKPDINDMIG